MSPRFVLVVILLLVACGNDEKTMLVAMADEPAGANCASGGIGITSGRDTNGNGTLDAGEVTSTRYACNTSQAGVLVDTSAEPPGANCANGGTRLDAGLDDNGNATLDASEIDSTQYVCNSSSGGPIIHYGDLRVVTAADLADAQTYTVITGTLTFDIDYRESAIASTMTFANLAQVGGIMLTCAPGEPSFGFPVLTAVNGDLKAGIECGSTDQASLDAPVLTTIAGELAISGFLAHISMPALASVDVLSLDGTIYLSDPDLSGLARVTTMSVTGNHALDGCYGWELLKQVTTAGGVVKAFADSGNQTDCADTSLQCMDVATQAGDATGFWMCFTAKKYSDARTACQAHGAGWDLAYFASNSEFTTFVGSAALPWLFPGYWFGYNGVGHPGTWAWVQNVAGSTYAPQSSSDDPEFWFGDTPVAFAGWDCAALQEGGFYLTGNADCNYGQPFLCRQLAN